MKKQLRDLESKNLWIQARVDELMGDDEWLDDVADDWYENADGETLDSFAKDCAMRKAEREHASIIADLEESIIDSMELK